MTEIDPDTIEQSIREVLTDIADHRDTLHGDGEWTAEIMRRLSLLGKLQGYSAYASKCDEACSGEWLYDLCWLVVDREGVNKNVLRAPLILECEWDRGGLMDDFPKLIMGRADLRVFIYQARNETECQVHNGKLIAAVEDSELTVTGDRYLLACWDMDQKKFAFYPYVKRD